MRKQRSRDHPEGTRGARAKVFSVLESIAAIMLVIIAVGALSSVFARKKDEAELPEAPPGIVEPSVPDKPTGPVVEVIIPADPGGDTPWVTPELEWE